MCVAAGVLVVLERVCGISVEMVTVVTGRRARWCLETRGARVEGEIMIRQRWTYGIGVIVAHVAFAMRLLHVGLWGYGGMVSWYV